MITEIQEKITQYKLLNDIHQYRLVLDAAELFIKSYKNGVKSHLELDLGIELFKQLISVNYICSLHQYEYDYALQNEILFKKIKVFKACIPESHSKLRGLTEMLVGMKENELG